MSAPPMEGLGMTLAVTSGRLRLGSGLSRGFVKNREKEKLDFQYNDLLRILI